MNLRHFKIRHRVTQTQMAFFIAAVFQNIVTVFLIKKNRLQDDRGFEPSSSCFGGISIYDEILCIFLLYCRHLE